MKKTCLLAALPLVLSLTYVPAAYALTGRPDWPDVRAVPQGSYLLIPYRHTEEHRLRGSERWFVPPPAAESQVQARDPFADLHFE